MAAKRPMAGVGGGGFGTLEPRQAGAGAVSAHGGGSVTLSVSRGDGCTLLGPAAPAALSEEAAAPDTDTGSHTDRPNMTRRHFQTRPDGAPTPSEEGHDGKCSECRVRIGTS